MLVLRNAKIAPFGLKTSQFWKHKYRNVICTKTCFFTCLIEDVIIKTGELFCPQMLEPKKLVFSCIDTLSYIQFIYLTIT